mmetsp:Transcript_2046/g.5159  ORF Transcript_2046/g.5159 Transcript_2046/m.5159 type:complete len:399 (+) Transcript_2046:254-1450(+)
MAADAAALPQGRLAALPLGEQAARRSGQRSSAADDDVVDFQDHSHSLCGHLDGADGHEQRLHHLLRIHVGDGTLLDVDAGILLALHVRGAELGHDLDGLHARILGQGVGHKLEGLGIGLDANCVDAADGPGPLGELARHLHLGGSATWDQGLLLHQAAHHTERVVNGALSLVQQKHVGGPDKDGAATTGDVAGLQAREPNDAALTAHEVLAHKADWSKLLGREVVQACDGLEAEHFGDEFDVVALDVADDQDLRLGAEVQGEVRRRISEDGLLNEQHIATGLRNLLHNLGDDGTLLTQETVHGRVVAHLNVALHVRLRRGEAELDQADLGVLHAARASRGLRDPLREHKAVHELAVVRGATDLLHDLDIIEVDVGRRQRIDDLEHCIHSNGCQNVRVL